MYISLEIPLSRFTISGFGEGNDTADAWIQGGRDALDSSPFPRCVSAFKQYNNAFLFDPDIALEYGEAQM